MTENTCKHCGLRIVHYQEKYWLHDEGQHRGKVRCAVNPYGYNAEPEGDTCMTSCLGHGTKVDGRVQ